MTLGEFGSQCVLVRVAVTKPSQGLFYFKVADTPLMFAIFRAYNDWHAEFCRTDTARLKGIAMITLDDVQDGIKELERKAGER
jgi:predicted TIM-barrel fold metal-dependent hydrolase